MQVEYVQGHYFPKINLSLRFNICNETRLLQPLAPSRPHRRPPGLLRPLYFFTSSNLDPGQVKAFTKLVQEDLRKLSYHIYIYVFVTYSRRSWSGVIGVEREER